MTAPTIAGVDADRFTQKTFANGATRLGDTGHAPPTRRPRSTRDTGAMVLHAWKLAIRDGAPVALVPTYQGLAPVVGVRRCDLSNGGYLVTPVGEVWVVA